MASAQTQAAQQPASTSSVPNGIDRYLVIHVATTCDEHGVYVTKDSAEVIEIGWILVDAKTLEELNRESVLVKPVNTPITPLCTSLTTITWETIRNAGSFRDAITRIDEFIREHIPQNGEFAFVTLDAWDLRVQLPREARDKAVVLPAYLQHSRTFDLRTEYTNWQQFHPESLPFGPSNLSNICAALEVEPVQSSAPIKHNLPFHLQALAPASPRRAMEEAITLTRVLKGLVRKSQPFHEHPTVLVHPMDARADVRAFLAERSKVLFMNGLPHDTTQSELESWFTQFGARPIAFWTMRTPDQHKPTGNGFAVFSSHEEAAEALCMNGRALNEKAIEVSPSSNRVLERAGEILTPFPPSKNRPRPGDWTCPSCGFSNFQRRTACFRCSFPAMSAAPAADPNMGFGFGYPPTGPPMMHNNYHAPPNPSKSMGASAPFRPGDWRCGVPDCMYHNFAKNLTCLRCGGSRANAIPMTAPNQFAPPPPHYANHHNPMGGFMDHGGAPGAPPPPSAAPGMGVPPGGFSAGAPGGPFPPGGFGPSAMGYPNPNAGFDPLGAVGYAPGVLPPGTGFDSRAEAAFAGAGVNSGPGGPGQPGAPPGFGNTGNANGGASGGSAFDGGADPFGFLGAGLAGLSLDESSGRRNGAHGTGGPAGKSPAA